MAIFGISKFETETFFSVKDKEKEVPFEIGSLDVDIKAKLTDEMYSMGLGDGSGGMNVGTNKNTTYLKTVKFGLRGWKNFKDKDGNEIPFVTGEQYMNNKQYTALADSSLQAMPLWLIREIGAKILESNDVDAGLAGNFDLG